MSFSVFCVILSQENLSPFLRDALRAWHKKSKMIQKEFLLSFSVRRICLFPKDPRERGWHKKIRIHKKGPRRARSTEVCARRRSKEPCNNSSSGSRSVYIVSYKFLPVIYFDILLREEPEPLSQVSDVLAWGRRDCRHSPLAKSGEPQDEHVGTPWWSRCAFAHGTSAHPVRCSSIPSVAAPASCSEGTEGGGFDDDWRDLDEGKCPESMPFATKARTSRWWWQPRWSACGRSWG